MVKKRILWLKSAIPWPLDQGTNFIALNLFRQLSADYHITYLALTGPGDAERLEALREYVEVFEVPRPNLRSRVHRALYSATYRLRSAVSFLPSEIFYELPRVYRRAVKEQMELGRYDLLFMHYWYLAELGDWLSDYNTAVLLHDNEVERLITERASFKSFLKRRKWSKRAAFALAAHRRMMDRVRNVFFYTANDRDAFFTRGGRQYGNARVFPYFFGLSPVPEVEVVPGRVIFTGKMSYRPNELAAVRLARGIWPLIRERCPEAELILAGRNPGPEVRRLAELPGVTVTGFVEDLRTLVSSAAVYVAPVTVGGGLKIKLMEAAELSRPIVASHFALTGFGFEHGTEALIRDTDEEIAAAVADLLGAPERAAKIGRAGREALLRRFSGPGVEEDLRALFAEITG
jgi:glycosyltransferase involved in cell wall biosynthesis